MAICKMIRPIFRGCSRASSAEPIWFAVIARKRKDTLVKRITSRIANFVRSRFTKDGVRDTGCTLKAMRRECVARAHSLQGHAPFHPGAGQRAPVIAWSKSRSTIGRGNSGPANTALATGLFRATVDMFGVRWLLSRQFSYRIRPD